MKTKSIGFGEAVRSLAAEAGMQPYRFSNFDQKKDLRFQTYKSIFKDYSYYFHQKLFNSDKYNFKSDEVFILFLRSDILLIKLSSYLKYLFCTTSKISTPLEHIIDASMPSIEVPLIKPKL